MPELRVNYTYFEVRSRYSVRTDSEGQKELACVGGMLLKFCLPLSHILQGSFYEMVSVQARTSSIGLALDIRGQSRWLMT